MSRKFNLFSRASFAALAAAATGGATVTGDPDDENPEAGPKPDEPNPDTNDGAADDAKPAGEGSPEAGADAEAALQVVPVADATAVAAEQFAAGRKAENARTAAVLGSDIGKANVAMATWMLSTSPDASADAIIAQLSTMPGAVKAGAAAPAATVIPDTSVDLGNASAAAALGGEVDADGTAVWKEVQGESPVPKADGGRFVLPAAAITTGGASLASPPAVRPTGN